MAFEKLSVQQREVLFLVDIAGMTYSEAGEVMDVPVGTVIINERETLDTLYVLLSGTVEVFLPETESRFFPPITNLSLLASLD